MKINIKLLFLVAFILSISGCSNDTKNLSSSSSNLSVSVSFHAMEEFVKVVGQDKVTISTIVPTGMEAHNFEPKLSQITSLGKAHVFVYNGLDMEPWVEKTIEAAENESLTIVNASKNIHALLNVAGEETDLDQEDHGHEHGSYDPHVWISLKGAISQVETIANGLSQADPDNKTFYQANATAYIKQLDELYEEYREKFDLLKNKDFVTGHAAFQYFCKDFGLHQNSVENVFAQGEPSTKQLAELVDYCIDNQVTTIFFEKSASPEISQRLADEVGAKVVPIHTIENPEGGMTYLERMKENCEEVYTSLSK